MIDRLIESGPEAIEAPMWNPDPARQRFEGYLGWGAICFGAASVGIRISEDECAAAIAVTRLLNQERVDARSPKLVEAAYKRIIRKSKLIDRELISPLARAAARL